MATLNMNDRIRHARRVSAPVIAINSPDQQSTVRTVTATFDPGTIALRWDVLRGVRPVDAAHRPSREVADAFVVDGNDVTIGNPVALLERSLAYTVDEKGDKVYEVPENTVIFMLNANHFLWEQGDKVAVGVLQGVCNLRDEFKVNTRTLIMLDKLVRLPETITNDVVALDEPLPTAAELRQVVLDLDAEACKDARHKPLTEEHIQAAIEAVEGLSWFAAEQTIAMALRSEGIDIDHAWQLKQSIIEQTRGLSVFRGGMAFESLGGLSQIKKYLRRLMKGPRRPRLIVWLDEFEKSGVTATGDSSGVNQDAEGMLLQWLQDHRAYGMLAVGVPGCGKSALAKALAAEFGITVIRLDLGAMQGSLVGQSQERIRAALKVVEAVGADKTLWFATSNSIEKLSAAMKSRFTDTYYFDLCDEDERKAMWDVQLKQFGLNDKRYPNDEGWVGRNVYQCCEKAIALECSVAEAAENIVPVGVVDREMVEKLRATADGRYLSASHPGVYRRPVESATTGKSSRKMRMAE